MRPAVLALVAACARSPRPEVPPVNLPWVPFYWVRATTDSARFDQAGILFRLEVRPGAPPSIVQLDLGGSGSMPDGFPPPGRELGSLPPIGKGQLYGLTGMTKLEVLGAERDTSFRRWQEGDIGTVGMPNYLDRILVVDFEKRRLAAVDRATSADAVLGPGAETVPLERGRFDRAVVPLSKSGGETFRALLDTGLSPFPLWTTRAIWQRLTGLDRPGPGTRAYRITNRRGEMVFVGAKSRATLWLGGQLFQPEVVYLARGPMGARLDDWSNGVDVVLGASFWKERVVLLFDLARHQLVLGGRPPR